MGLMPQGLAAKIQFVEAHLADWVAHAAAIGSSAPEIASIQTLCTAARSALNTQESAQETAKTKTAALRDSVEALVVATSDLVKKIRAKAATDGNTIYQLANIPAPATPSPIGAPGKPGEFEATLEEDGSLDLTWKCAQPAGAVGTTYNVYRRTTPTGEYTFLGTSGQKKFVDSTIPAGSSQVTYKVRAIRSTAAGQWATFNVTFGMSGGAMTASVTETTPKLAA